jgi:hypothetical protein
MITMIRTLVPALLLAACGSTQVEVAQYSGDRLAPTTLYPMLEGAQWVYDVETGGPEPPTLGIFEVIEVSGARRTIANNRGMDESGTVTHADPIEYEVTSDGIRHVSSGGWVLRAPIREGASWDGMGGRTARVSDLDSSIEVFAGEYDGCVTIEETGGEDGRVVTTTYCPGVGPVAIESRIETQITMRSVATRARLRSYDPGGAEEL